MSLSKEERARINQITIDRRENRERKDPSLALKRKAKQAKYAKKRQLEQKGKLAEAKMVVI